MVGLTRKAVARGMLPRRLKAHLILRGELRGCRIVTSWHDYPAAILGRTERPLLKWFSSKVRTGQTWLDIGAHYGYTAIALSRLVGAEGRVFAFEPHIATAGCLAQTRAINRLPQLSVVPLALGQSRAMTRRTMHTVRGMIDRTLDGATAGSPGLEESFLEASLDAVWPGLAGANLQVHGIKIDVQGMEIDAVSGMEDLLRQCCPALVIEVHRGVSRPRLLELLESAGYDPAPTPVEPLPGEDSAFLADDRSYAFTPRARA